MKIPVIGGSGSDRATARSAYKDVMRVLPSDAPIEIEIGDWPDRPERVEAACEGTRVKITEEAMRHRLSGRASYLLYEEITHAVMFDRGLPHEGVLEVFFQEFFASYVKFTLAQCHHPEMFTFDAVTIPLVAGADEVEREEIAYIVGTDLGGELAGIAGVTAVLDEWLAREDADEDIAGLTRELRSHFEDRDLTISGLADEVLEMYRFAVNSAV